MQPNSPIRDKNYYDILEVPSTATQDEVYDSYVRAKNAYSQDSLAMYSLMSKEECHLLLNQIEEAYIIISDPVKRTAYDSARGINVKQEDQEYQKQNFELKGMHHQVSSHNTEKVQNTNITKLVAANKYSLSYEKNIDFEQLIEQTNDFTGEFLKRIREYKNVPIQRMTEMTKISKNYLNSIEDEKIQNLPALVYVRGFVYQYAKCLKLNPDVVATSMLQRFSKLKGQS